MTESPDRAALRLCVTNAQTAAQEAREAGARSCDPALRSLILNAPHWPGIDAARRLLASQDHAAELADAVRAILFQVIQGKVLERDACVTQARRAFADYQRDSGDGQTIAQAARRAARPRVRLELTPRMAAWLAYALDCASDAESYMADGHPDPDSAAACRSTARQADRFRAMVHAAAGRAGVDLQAIDITHPRCRP